MGELIVGWEKGEIWKRERKRNGFDKPILPKIQRSHKMERTERLCEKFARRNVGNARGAMSLMIGKPMIEDRA